MSSLCSALLKTSGRDPSHEEVRNARQIAELVTDVLTNLSMIAQASREIAEKMP